MPLEATFAADANRGYGFGLASGVSAGYDSIATLNGNGSSSSVTFSSIPTSYSHLQIRCLMVNTAAGTGTVQAQLQMNSDTSTNYSWHWLGGSGGNPSANGGASASFINLLGGESYAGSFSIWSVGVIDIMDYNSTAINKTIRWFGGANGNETGGNYSYGVGSGVWRQTNSVTSITIKTSSGNAWASSSRFALYGIKAA